MAVSSLKVLRDAIRQRAFEPAYYIFGEDEFQKEDAVKQLVRATVDPGTRDFNLEFCKGSEVDSRQLDSALQSLPMMAERRTFVLRDVNSLKKDVRKVLDAYLKNPSRDNVVILVSGPDSKEDKTLAALAAPLEFDPLTPDRIPKWIQHYTTTELNAGITPAAADLLFAAVGNDLHQLCAELDKLCSYAGPGGEIDETAVAAIVGVRRGEMMPDLLDAIAMRNTHRALEILPTVLAQPKTSGVQIVMALAAQTLGIGWAAAKKGDGQTGFKLQNELFDLLKQSGGAYTGRSWGSAVNTWISATDSWYPEAICNALDALLDADVMLKETRLSSEEQVIADVILRVCAYDRRRSAA